MINEKGKGHKKRGLQSKERTRSVPREKDILGRAFVAKKNVPQASLCRAHRLDSKQGKRG